MSLPGNLAAGEALRYLAEGNRRFVARRRRDVRPGRRAEVRQTQHPFAVVLGCADSRVPPELVFDQGLGDLFVVRVAGNIAGRSQIGSIEFAVQSFGVRLVLVLGHSGCGAVKAALGRLAGSPAPSTPSLEHILSHILPVAEAPAGPPAEDPEIRMRRLVQANVRASMATLCADSELLRRHVRDGEVEVAGAVYDLDTGIVEPVSDGGGPTAA